MDYSCLDCTHAGRYNYCSVCTYRTAPDGRETKPTLWERKRPEAAIAIEIADTVADGEAVPEELITKYITARGK